MLEKIRQVDNTGKLKANFEVYRRKNIHSKFVPLHHHNFYEVYFLVNGSVEYNVENKTYSLTPGDILLISPLELHAHNIHERKTGYECMVLWINAEFLDKCCTEQTNLKFCFNSSEPNYSHMIKLPVNKRQTIFSQVENLIAQQNDNNYGADLLLIAKMIDIMININQFCMQANTEPKTENKSDVVVAKVIDYIEQNYHEELSLDFLADKFFISKFYLSREFNRVVGVSVYKYIIQRRLFYAKALLGNSIPPTDVYLQCGFGDYANFYRAFKSAYHISPKEFVDTIEKGRV